MRLGLKVGPLKQGAKHGMPSVREKYRDVL